MSPGAESDLPRPPEAFQELLAKELPSFGIRISSSGASGISVYLSELDSWRRTANLTGPLSARELARHALESTLGAGLIVDGERVVDVGSGAGFPGVPIAIERPDLSVALVEPRQKRCAFLRHVLRTLRLTNATVIEDRIEKVGGQTFGVATSRAVGSFTSWIGNAGFLQGGGTLLAWTTRPAELAGELSALFSFERAVAIPGSEKREIAVFRKKPSDVPRGTRGVG